ncbi:MAG: hypothetical protein WC607_05005, partial [Candidatus Micrarchaeia archaeon]
LAPILYFLRVPFTRKDVILVSFSRDGLRWTPGVTAIGWLPSEDMVFQPCVVDFGSYYRMYYRGTNERDQIVSATSRDGVKWTRERGVRLKTKGGRDNFPFVLRHGKAWRMYWARSTDGTRYEIRLAESADGKEWRDKCVALERAKGEVYVAAPRVFPAKGGWRMYFDSFDGKTNRVLSAFSRDGVKWRREAGARIEPGGVFDSVFAGHAWLFPDGKRLYYAGDNAPGVNLASVFSGKSRFRILSCVLRGGKWVKEAGARIEPGQGKACDGVFSPCVIRLRDGRLALYYTGYWGDYLLKPFNRLGFALGQLF